MGMPRLLVIDDNPVLGEIVQFVAESSGFEVKLTTGAIEFQEHWSSEGATAIAMDIVMPGMDGIELIKWLAQQKCTAPIIVMSGYAGRYCGPAVRIGLGNGVNIVGALKKPFAREELENMLERALQVAA